MFSSEQIRNMMNTVRYSEVSKHFERSVVSLSNKGMSTEEMQARVKYLVMSMRRDYPDYEDAVNMLTLTFVHATAMLYLIRDDERDVASAYLEVENLIKEVEEGRDGER